MTTELDDLLKKSAALREEKRVDEAILIARRAVALDANSANAYWQLALALYDKKELSKAIENFKTTISLADEFPYGWYRLGLAYEENGEDEHAINAWESACELDDELEDARYKLIDKYNARKKDADKETLLNHLTALNERGKLRRYDWHLLAIAHHNRHDYATAIPYYKRYLTMSDDVYGYTNLALAYSSSDISQDLDAADCCRLALERNSKFENAQTLLKGLESKLISVKARVNQALTEITLVPRDAWYRNYVSPYELLRYEDDYDPTTFDLKDFQRAKKVLLQEIELEDGKIDWVPGLTIDRSRAIRVCEELSNEAQRLHHWIIFQFKPLLRFLSRCDIDLFTYDREDSVVEFLHAHETDDDFREWLSNVFHKQFDLIFGAVFQSRKIDLIEALLDGRRFATESDDEKCFTTARRACDGILQGLELLETTVAESKPTRRDIDNALSRDDLGKLLEILPSPFYDIQAKAAECIRSISVGLYNHHQDPDLAREVIGLAKNFAKRSPLLRVKLEKDAATLDQIIKDAKKDEVTLNFGTKPFKIDRTGIKYGHLEITPGDVDSVRWGINIERSAGLPGYNFLINVGGNQSRRIDVKWTATNGIADQEKLFQRCVNALFAYILPTLIDTITTKLGAGHTLTIGGLTVTRSGVTFTVKGWFSDKREFTPWTSLRSEISNGHANLRSAINEKARASLSLSEVDNAWLLHLIIQEELLQ
jgi:tetratricopeptide (TPR) repeat protein